MKKFNFAILALSAFFLLTGFGGTMDVKEPLKFNARKGLENINEGTYQIELNRKNKNRLRLIISADEKNNETETDILFPEGKNLDQLDGVFTLTPSESGQPYLISGDYSAEEVSGAKRFGQQQCSLEFRETYCWIDVYGFRRCEDRWVTRYGYQNISYIDTLLTEEFHFSFKKEESSTVAAAVSAINQSMNRKVLEKSNCFIY